MVHHPGHWTNNIPLPGSGPIWQTKNPVTQEIYWLGQAASTAEIDAAIDAAKQAARLWQPLSFEARETQMRHYAEILLNHAEDIAQTIALETGKPLWESRAEVQAMVQKIPISITAYQERCPTKQFSTGPRQIHVKHHPHGVMAVLGAFNFPGHLPNGHIVPALLAGNTLVFKPSEHSPLTGLLMAELWKKAGLPAGVLNLVFGGKDVGSALVTHPDIAGVCFTGSAQAGIAISKSVAHTPWKMVALEMGGNNPLVILDWENQAAVMDLILLSAFQTSGQRCTCARRLILLDTQENRALAHALPARIATLKIGESDSLPEPFMGPVISVQAATQLYVRYQDMLAQGAAILVPMRNPEGSAFVNPTVLDTTGITISDDEAFGPLLTVQWADTVDAAYAMAANTRYGLSAGLVAKEAQYFERFTAAVPAGIYTFNCPTTGASSAAPFGGVGMSGNHRASAYYAADYCAYPTAMSTSNSVSPTPDLPGFR